MFHGPLWASRLRPEHQFAHWGARCFFYRPRGPCVVYICLALSVQLLALLAAFIHSLPHNQLDFAIHGCLAGARREHEVCLCPCSASHCLCTKHSTIHVFCYKTCACNPINQSMAHMHVSPGPTPTRFDPAVGCVFRIDHEGTVHSTERGHSYFISKQHNQSSATSFLP